MYEFINKGLCREVGLPGFGEQDRGVSPGGAMDLFSLKTGNLLLGNGEGHPGLEIVIPPEVKFLEDCFCVLTGAGYDSIQLLVDGNFRPVEHAVVFKAPTGSLLQFGTKMYGFRSYLCCTPVRNSRVDLQGRKRGDFNEMADWSEPDNVVRLIEGPEYHFLDNPSYLVDHPWKISNDVSNMGMRLTCLRQMPTISLKNMISGPVADGTIQLTPRGPIILLRHRQTVGGYPRIFNVISTDIDKLGQFAPGQIIRFRQVSPETAWDISRHQAEVLDSLARRFSALE